MAATNTTIAVFPAKYIPTYSADADLIALTADELATGQMAVSEASGIYYFTTDLTTAEAGDLILTDNTGVWKVSPVNFIGLDENNALINLNDPSNSLPEANIFVGNASGNAVGVPMTGKISITNAGVTDIVDNSIIPSELNAALRPSHAIKYAGEVTWSGGTDTLSVPVVGVTATDLVVGNIHTQGTEAAYLAEIFTTDGNVNFALSAANTSNDAVLTYQVFRSV